MNPETLKEWRIVFTEELDELEELVKTAKVKDLPALEAFLARFCEAKEALEEDLA